MRGKPHRGNDHRGSHGITPAHAGKTSEKSQKSLFYGDHPRACGENVSAYSSTTRIAGSPPRMRGKRVGKDHEAGLCGITPAHAGKTVSLVALGRLSRDHPRACGENISKDYGMSAKAGSPPRMRGKPRLSRDARADDGITPAHAGKTSPSREHNPCREDHPRACGENLPQP